MGQHLQRCGSARVDQFTFIVFSLLSKLIFNMAHEQKAPTPSPAQGVGPTYRREDEKPTATVSKEVSYENVHILPQTPQLIALLT